MANIPIIDRMMDDNLYMIPDVEAVRSDIRIKIFLYLYGMRDRWVSFNNIAVFAHQSSQIRSLMYKLYQHKLAEIDYIKKKYRCRDTVQVHSLIERLRKRRVI